jgi:hypothetical protein
MSTEEYSIETAREAAARDQLEAWVAAFLASPGSDNAELAEILSNPPRWWLGPVELPLDQLNRLAGPPGEPVLVEVEDEDEWRDDVQDLAEKVDDGHEPPPIIVSYRDDQLVVEDGNHRLEALRRAGEREAWAVVGFEHEEELERFISRSKHVATEVAE